MSRLIFNKQDTTLIIFRSDKIREKSRKSQEVPRHKARDVWIYRIENCDSRHKYPAIVNLITLISALLNIYLSNQVLNT